MSKLFFKRIIIFSMALTACFNASAQQKQPLEYHGDSVMESPNTGFSKPGLVTNKKIQANTQRTNMTEEKDLRACPIGFTGSHNTQYVYANRFIMDTYLNNVLLKTQQGGWRVTNEECSKKEIDTIACPDGYDGSISRERTVTSSGNASSWAETGRTCVLKPVVCPTDTTYCKGTGVGGGGVILKYGYLKYGPAPSCTETTVAVGNERFGSQELRERGSQDCPAPFGDYVDPNVPPPRIICKAIKPTQSGTLYSCTNPDGTTYYTEEPPTNEPIDPVPPTTCEEQSLPGQNGNNNFCVDAPARICPLSNGKDAKIGTRLSPCDFDDGYGNAAGYAQGEVYVCLATGWKHVTGNPQFHYVCE